MTTLTEFFPCFFLSCKANARVKLTSRGTVRTLQNYLSLCCAIVFLFVVIVLCSYLCCSVIIVLLYVLIVCTVTLPPGVNPIAVDKYICLSITTLHIASHIYTQSPLQFPCL